MKFTKAQYDDDVFSIPEWNTYTLVGVITPDDGTGCWAKWDANERSYYYAYELSPFTHTQPEWATHVAWFNK